MSSSYNFEKVHQDRLNLSQVNAETLNVSGNAVVGGTASSTLGFFGNAGVAQEVVATTATLSELIAALQDYGLVRQS